MLFKLVKVTENVATDGESQNRSRDNQRVLWDGESVGLNEEQETVDSENAILYYEGQDTEMETHLLPRDTR